MQAYSPSSWDEIDSLGKALDLRLRSQGLQLTMGAEPTYLRLGGQQQPEWSQLALGDEKWQLARQLAERLRARFFPKGLLQHGQGKLYPGETSARWALRCFDLVARKATRRGDPQQFLQALCPRLGLPEAQAATWEGGRALVLGRKPEGDWQTASWTPLEIVLLEVEGPAGLRLPWNQLPADHPARQIGTALCVESDVEGLRVFLPPLPDQESWLLLAQHCLDTGYPVQFEGYGPPMPQPGQSWPALKQLSVTPDPGVIEINLHPAGSWPELVDTILGVDEECRQAGLVPYRLGLDGLVSGSGGGCHLVVGGPRPEQSPFAHRPDFLRSILTYWNHHPALSYLFSGLFIGPTSQAPRVDEARHDSLYELELAFRELDLLDPSSTLVGPILRDLLVDVSGNGHRSEICVDKLFDPLKPGGQQGLLEFRALEMPPDPKMNLATMLLFRALLWKLWRTPEKAPLKRYGCALHDRYMLPTCLWQDLLDILKDLSSQGVQLKPEWYLPHLEFRCPLLGSCTYQGVLLELRQALEPWPVLGENSTTSGPSRPVDSSTQRLEVKVHHWDAGRWALACNGHILPLQPLERQQAVLGVRFRAWRFAQSLHPTLGAQVPLQFDLLDLDLGRPVASCRYHSQHPQQGPWSEPPADLNEAARRRAVRFEKLAPAPSGSEGFAAAQPQPDFPWTFDLRWQALQRSQPVRP